MKSSPCRVGIHSLVRAWFLAALLPALLLAGCGGGSGGDDSGGGGGDPSAPTLVLVANPTTVTTGGTITLSWATTNATSCTASGAWSGSKATSGNENITAAAAGSTMFALSCGGQGGNISRSATVTVNSPSPTLSLAANVGTVNVGGSFTLSWSTTNVSSCIASGGWTGAKATAGSENFNAVSPGTITYTLACDGASGSTTQSATVTIVAVGQATLTLNATPATVVVGSSFTLQWTSTNVSTCTASGAWSGGKATAGNQMFSASSSGTATYTLACTGAGGSISRSATVTITPAQQPDVGIPYIVVNIIGFNRDAQVPELVSPGKSALAYVDVWNQAGTAPVTNATVSINGTTLPYYGSLQEYAAELNVSPGATITASITVNGTPYVASTRQFDTYPVITTPLESASWTNSVPNEIDWHGASSRPGAQLLVRMLGPSSGQDWPPGDWINASGTNSYTVPAGALAPINYVLLVGYADVASFAGALPGSAFVLGGFDQRHVSVSAPPPGPPNVTALVFKTQAPVAVGVNGTKQMAVDATVNCCTTSDWTTKADWSSSNPAILTVNSIGIVTGVAPGTANVIATYNGVSASMAVRVFQPTPLPASPPTASTAFQVDHTHAGYLTLGAAPALPLTNRWTASFAGKVSYPVVADGRVFVVVDRGLSSNGVLGSSIYALDVNTGATLWGPLDHSSSYRWAAHTYANGKLFVITADGLLSAIDAATGAIAWSVQMPGNNFYSAPPVAANGLVYLSYGQGLMLAVDQQDGAIVWKASVANGMDSSPTLGSNGLFVSYACDAYRLDPLSGDEQWHYRGACASGGGGTTSVLAGDKLLAGVYTGPGSAFTTFNVSDGSIVSGFAPAARPAVAGGIAYFVSSGALRAVDIATNTTRWTYTADPTLNSAPLVIDNMVAVGSSSGAVYLIDATTGNQLWNGQAAAGVSATYEGSATMPSGLGAGSGYLLVPGGNTLTAWKMIQ